MDIFSFKRQQSEITKNRRTATTEKKRKSNAEEVLRYAVEKPEIKRIIVWGELDFKVFQASLDKASLIKEQGNWLFKNGNYKEAVLKYYEAIDYIPNHIFKQVGLEEYERFKLSIITNLVICFFKLCDYSATQLQCEEGLKLYPDNVKLKYYYGLAIAEQQQYDRAITVLKQALRLDPGNSEISNRIQLILDQKNSSYQGMKGIFLHAKEPNSYSTYLVLGGLMITSALVGFYLYKQRKAN